MAAVSSPSTVPPRRAVIHSNTMDVSLLLIRTMHPSTPKNFRPKGSLQFSIGKREIYAVITGRMQSFVEPPLDSAQIFGGEPRFVFRCWNVCFGELAAGERGDRRSRDGNIFAEPCCENQCRGKRWGKVKGCDIGYALAVRSCEGANSVEACTVTAFDAITAFAVPNPNYSSQSRRFFRVWLLIRLPF